MTFAIIFLFPVSVISSWKGDGHVIQEVNHLLVNGKSLGMSLYYVQAHYGLLCRHVFYVDCNILVPSKYVISSPHEVLR
ncbi:hypothetical protein KP509_29G022600 [Ceratopteris richardii]|uniref:Secreted protein n=1 Tax=Ceratopteris richardii TaxID=49495 RepID=A0A8T2R5H2_CERRI|nr:hypothetical protein KP509_29G022600 [Ceratopteris richardii]